MIPDYQRVMLPLLKYAGDKEEHHIQDAIERLADDFNLTEEERKELLPSGLQAIFDNRVGWANTYLKKAGLLESTHACSVKGICKSILFKHTKITVYLQKQMLFF
jgi:restriction system protein